MSLKLIDKNNMTYPKQSFSITTRLTFLSTLFFFLILSLSLGFLYWNLKQSIERQDAKFLVEEIYELRSVVDEYASDWPVIEREIMEGVVGAKFSSYYKRILNENKQTLIETPRMNELMPADSFPSIDSFDPSSNGKKIKAHDGRTFMLMTIADTNDATEHKKYILQLAVDVSKDQELINDYRLKIIFVLFLSIIFSCGINIIVIRTSMKPLKEITKKVRQVTASQLHERINAEYWPQELGKLAIAFDEMLDRLEDSFSRLSQFSVNLAHELRTPINNLMGEAQVTLSKARDLEEYQHVLESSLEEYNRLKAMIDTLLFLARTENNEIKLERVAIDVRKEIDAVIEFFEAIAQEHKVGVIASGQAVLNTDSVLFRRIISNLVMNALQYTPAQGKITIDIQSLPHAITISIKDTGAGIAKEELAQIFNRFYRAPSARTKYPQGMGLGLHIVKSIMQIHGGTVTIESIPTQGTTVILNFPIL